MNRDIDILEKLEKELSLKELQIKSLLTITQAINDNVPADGLYNMYRSFLSWEMGISRMALYVVNNNGDWSCTTNINFDTELQEGFIQLLIPFKRLHTIRREDDPALKSFDIIIPVFHKKQPIAYSVIGGIRDKEDLYNKIQFITTITNIIAVAIENKRLFNTQLQQERLNREIQLAKDVQTMLIPDKLPKEKHYQLSSIYKPHFNIGGDYFDCIKFSKDKFAFCIADVSGKGVAAALLMANFQAMIQSLIFQYRDLETFVFALNQAVYRLTKSDKFITFFICEIDTKKREIRYINAGHYPPIMRTNGKINRLTEGCTVIGAFEKLPSIKEGLLKYDDEVLIMSFTDGLADLRNDAGDYFEDDNIESFITKNANLPVDEFNDELLKVIDDFKGKTAYPDDIAVLTCKVQ